MKISTIKVDCLLAEQKLRKSEYATKCGMSQQSLSAILRRGSCEPRTAGRLAAGLGVTVRDIAGEVAS